jgi:hypothetical protein
MFQIPHLFFFLNKRVDEFPSKVFAIEKNLLCPVYLRDELRVCVWRRLSWATWLGTRSACSILASASSTTAGSRSFALDSTTWIRLDLDRIFSVLFLADKTETNNESFLLKRKWKSRRIKIHSIGHRFSYGMDFLWIFGCFECVSSMFLCKVITNLKFPKDVLSKTTFRSIFVSQDDFLCTKEIHRLRPMDLKIYSLERNPQLWLDSLQSLETFANIISVNSTSGVYQQ